MSTATLPSPPDTDPFAPRSPQASHQGDSAAGKSPASGTMQELLAPGGIDAIATRGPLPKNAPLGQRLIGENLVSPEDLAAALELQAKRGAKLGETLLDMGVAAEDDLLPHIAAQLGVAAVRLREGLVDPEIVRILPREFCEKHAVLALLRVRGVLVVAIDDPHDLDRLDLIERRTGLATRPVFAFRGSIDRMIRRAFEDDFQVDAVTADMDESAVELQADLTDIDLTAVQDMVGGSPVVNLVNYIILQAIRRTASDIHIEPSKKHGVIRFRIDGQLIEMLRPRKDIYPAVVSRIKVMAKLDIAEQRKPQDGRCQVMVDGKEVDLRVSTLPTVVGEKVVMRVLDKQRLTFNLDELGIPPRQLADIKTMIGRPHGLMLVTGPTGCGKTTTLYSALELIKSVSTNLVTVEDPVEYQIELVNQVQVDSVRGLSFASSLRSILRQDPDVIMIGEIRDPETAQVAVQAALTGHLVLSTLHTNDAVGAVARMVDMGVESYKLSAALVGVLAQRLVRMVCPHCRTTHYVPTETLEAMHYKGDHQRRWSRGEGCRHCYDTGFQGRTGIYETLLADDALRRFITSSADPSALRNWLSESGRPTLLTSGLELAERGVTSLEEVTRVALFD
ncbi:GspE/PulE family protein [Botrimarina hoheduenensis]|uniref:Putative type II secretion system protein E n=1 Tax=Botrimarina hoheduenensis TaxID=2528000 RepID=A0A5C5VN98_9BACT|nr:GspE/PulE family protein [Botrimarina hoheduenensis]TWT40146.1 putative type II secretion system protein E [Botrimarina hoheduenensis]